MAVGKVKLQAAPRDAGLFVDLLDVDEWVKINDLEGREVTDPIMLSNGMPSPRGVLSYEIFGTSQEDRKRRFGYIDLHGHYMNPMAALKLGSYDRRLSDILFARGRWKLTKEFLYSIWGKIKVKEKDTVITKEVEVFYKMDKDVLFLSKFPVIPPFTRDLNQKTNSSSKSTALINSMYNSLISYTQSC